MLYHILATVSSAGIWLACWTPKYVQYRHCIGVQDAHRIGTTTLHVQNEIPEPLRLKEQLEMRLVSPAPGGSS
jgi:hypothetical protein